MINEFYDWKEFYIKDIFEISKSKKVIIKSKLNKKNKFKKYEKETTPLISASIKNNGEDLYLRDINITPELGNCITIVNDSVHAGTAFYQNKPFYSNGHISILRNKKLNKYNSIFITTILTKNFYKKYDWTYAVNLTRLKIEKIKLPINNQGNIDYNSMENYIKKLYGNINIKIQNISKYFKKEYRFNLDNFYAWKEFYIKDIFEIKKGNQIKKQGLLKGNLPFITTTTINNGISRFIKNNNYKIYRNCLTITNNGDCGTIFYHDYDFTLNSDVSVLINKFINKYNSLFIKTLFEKNISKKYSWNRKLNIKLLKQEKIKLPINNKSNIDYTGMENYIKERIIK